MICLKKIPILHSSAIGFIMPSVKERAMKFLLASILLITLSASAAIYENGKKGPGTAEEIVPGKILVRTIKLQEFLTDLSENQIVEKRDSQDGNNPDIFIVYKVDKNGSKELQMQLFDLNRDGKIDLVKHFVHGKLSREEKDTNFDGITDLVIEYDTATGAVRKKSQADGKTNIWTYYSKDEIYRKELDRNFDGKPDMWVYYRKGKIYRTEIDAHFDGKKIIKIDEPYTPAENKM
jgi:hypothetical protein